MSLTFLDFFAGIGGFRRGMELAGHKCIGFCEWDKFAVMSYTSMHLITEDQRQLLLQLPIKHRQKEILKEEYRNGEWYANDIRTVNVRDLPKADVWCFGFPCQDISIAGKRLGFAGKRSSLFFTVTGLIKDLEEKDKPSMLFIENVKNLLSVNRGLDFAKLLIELDEIGYDVEWQVLNTKDFGIPQSRERVFIIGFLRGRSRREVLPVRGSGCKNNFPLLKPKKYGDGILIRDVNKKGYSLAEVGDSISLAFLNSKTKRGRVGKGKVHTLTTACNQAVVCEKDRTPKIRKLTPRECFRLQGWTDYYFDKAAIVNSDNQLYKQAGNGVTVKVIQNIATKFHH
ncbi:DNA cytosine methyltransferase [Lacrimispora celerecrescens]|uniref:DNA cytosine methyltransferase n=1 Tax=Lacrimispora celerecrescens TaxID=29354 RepID=UPI000C233E00|nr:DNA cytosine methyltransferase [Lacrimispora celerecrescens]